MAVCKALHENDVVLYHPLNDFVEQTQTQTWTGSTNFVTGAIGSGVSAINTFNVGLGPMAPLPSGLNFAINRNGAAESNIIWMNPNLVAILYRTLSETIVTTANVTGNTITGFNTPAIAVNVPVLELSIAKLSSTQFVIGYGQGGNRHHRVGTVDGSGLVTFGPIASVLTGGLTSFGGPSIRLDSQRFLSSVGEADSSIFGMTMYVGEVSGVGSSATIALNAQIPCVAPPTGLTVTGARGVSFAMLPSTIDTPVVEGYMFWVGIGTPAIFALFATKISVSGSTITKGQTTIAPPFMQAQPHGFGALRLGFPQTSLALTDDVIITTLNNVNGVGVSNKAAIILARIDSSGQIIFDNTVIRSNMLDGPNNSDIEIAKAGSETDQSLNFHIHNRGKFGKYLSRMASVPSGVGSIQFGSAIDTFSIVGGHPNNSIGPVARFNTGDSRIFIASEEVFNIQGVIFGESATSNSQLTSPSGSIYPSTSTSTRVTFSTWIKDTLMTGGSFKIGRSFEVTVNPTTIVLDPSGVTWSVSLSSVLNDGNQHLVVLDFEHISAGQWRLRTSIDGTTWVDRGVQLFGNLPVGISDTAPRITMDNSVLDLGRWIDEAVMWKDTPLFTDQELTNMYELGSTLNLPICDYLIQFPFHASGNTTLQMTGKPIPPPAPTDPIPHNSPLMTLAMFADTDDNIEDDDREDALDDLHKRLRDMEDEQKRKKKRKHRRRKRKKMKDKHKKKK